MVCQVVSRLDYDYNTDQTVVFNTTDYTGDGYTHDLIT